MSELVDPTEIEKIFGVPRRKHEHLIMVKDGTMYIMHSKDCVDSGIDLRDCEYSVKMDTGYLKPNFSPWDSYDTARESDFDNGY